MAGRSTESLDLMNHPVENWWTKRQLDLVEDRSRSWRRCTFEPGPAVEQRVDGARVLRRASVVDPDASTVADGWDHEHCALCWGKISRSANGGDVGYSDGDNWLCIECFEQYVQPRLTA